jgi:pyruvate/oxaloacetate carboxyltransferase
VENFKKLLVGLEATMTGKIQFSDFTLRDGQQSLAATRMTTAQCLRVLETIRDAGYPVIELWGGATLDSCIRFTDEDPWERLETFYQVIGDKAEIQALLRGQNLFAYQPYPDDLVIAFTRQAIESGVGIMRIFDALNDPRNLQTALLATKAFGAKAEAALSYTVSPVHTTEYFVDYALKLQDEGADQVAIKDMSGILQPAVAFKLFEDLKSKLSIPLALHCHTTTGVAVLNGVIAMMAGLDSIDTAITPFSGGSSLPPVEVMIVFAEEMGLNFDLDKEKILEAQRELFVIADELKSFNPYHGKYYRPVHFDDVNRDQVHQVLKLLTEPGTESIQRALEISRQILKDLGYPDHDSRIFDSQIPGGMLTNLHQQLEQMGQPAGLIDQVMEEILRVRADVGYVPLVTPTSQIVGSQAAFNVILGERYSFVSDEFKMVLRGEFGRTPAEPNPEIVAKVLQSDEPPLKYRAASYLKPVLEEPYSYTFTHSKKDLLLYLLFGQAAEGFLRKRDESQAVPLFFPAHVNV